MSFVSAPGRRFSKARVSQNGMGRCRIDSECQARPSTPHLVNSSWAHSSVAWVRLADKQRELELILAKPLSVVCGFLSTVSSLLPPFSTEWLVRDRQSVIHPKVRHPPHPF